MLYLAYQAHSDFMVPMRTLANLAINVLAPDRPTNATAFSRNLSAAYELISRAGLTHDRPPFGIESVLVGNQEVAVHEEAARVTPFATLLHFKKNIDTAQPRVLVVAPLSGHFATLLRATVRTLLSDNDVYITDWHNARDVPRSAGRFGFDDYVQHIVDFLETIGPGAHIVAVCQPCVAALVAAAVMAQDANPAQPRSMTLMAGPIDTRVNPTKVNELANSKPIEWFEQNLIATVPMRYHGSFRRVYPGFVQLAAFMAMNIDRHVKAHRDLYDHLANGELEKAAVTKAFYDEYFAVLDLSEEFYIETVKLVFQEAALPLGQAHLPRRAGRAARHPPHHAAHCRGRARRHLRRRPDARRPRPLQRPAALPQAPPFAARRRPLRRIQRQPVDQPDLSDHQERDPLERVSAPS